MPSTLSSLRSWQLPAAAVFATMATAVGLGRLIQTGAWLYVVLLVAVLIALTGAGLRRLNLARPLIVLAQAVVVVLCLTVILAHGTAIGGLLPGPGALRTIANRLGQGANDLKQYSPPAPVTPDIMALMAVSGSAFAFVIDVIAVTCRRPVLAGAPMLAVYLIPATRMPGGLTWLSFIFAAAGYLALIGTDGHERLGQWGRAVHHRSARPSIAGATNTGLTRQIASWSIAFALIIPLLIPATPRLLDFGGTGGGGSGGVIFLNDTVDIAKDLSTSQPVNLFEYTTDAVDPRREYFQQDVLTNFTGDKWEPSTGALPQAPGSVSVPGLSNGAVERLPVSVSVTVDGNFGFSSAPSPYATTNASGLPDLSIDSHTLTVYVNDNESETTTRKGAQYSTQSTEITPTVAQLSNATVGHDPISKGYLALPSDVEQLLKTDADQITAGDTTAYQKAMSLENYFLHNFTYTLDPKVSGTGVDAITSFLKNKAGFCQQFAATMAAMARALDIPAVVAEGYTPGTAIPGSNEYQVTTHQAHAWPMLYFDGVGWVQFEPTPSIIQNNRADQQPWTQPQTQASGGATTQAGVTPTVTASGNASKSACANNDINRHVDGGEALPCSTVNPTSTARRSTPFASWGAFGVLPRTFERWFLTGNAAQIAVKLLLLALVLVAGLPGAFRLRRWRRRRRLLRKAAAEGGRRPRLPGQRSSVTSPDGGSTDSRFTGSAKARRELAFTAWEELREYATDLGYSWPESDTPRQLAGRLAGQAEFDQESSAAAGRVTTLVERAVYSPDPHIEADEAMALPGDVSRVRSALAAAAGRAARLRAAVLPNSSIDHMLRRGKHH